MSTPRHGPGWDLTSDPGPTWNTVGYSVGGNPIWTPSRSPRWKLSIVLTTGQAEQLMRQVSAGRRVVGTFTTEAYACDVIFAARGIELTGAEADEIRAGAHPLDVLFPVWPELGYRLVAVPVTNLEVT